MVFVAGLLLWRALLAWRGQPLPGRWLLGGLLLLALGATWVSHGTFVGRDAGVTLIVLLLALKTLELRARRDAMVVFFLGFFALLANFFYCSPCCWPRPWCWACWACSRPWSMPT